jgi:hypothetical protein
VAQLFSLGGSPHHKPNNTTKTSNMSDTKQNPDSPEPSSPVIEKPSRMAKASFVIGLVSVGIWILVVVVSMVVVAGVVAGSHANQDPNATMDSKLPLLMFVGFLGIANLILNIVGFFLGTAALQKSIPNKWQAGVGALINGVAAAAMIILFIVGHGGHH